MTNTRDSHMTNGRVEVITSIQRRRRWPRAEKERIVAASLEPSAIASEVARAAGIHTSQLYRWRRDLCRRAEGKPAFAAVTVAPAAASAVAAVGTIEIEFARGVRLRITGTADAVLLSAAIRALAGER
jgi:transposase